MNVGSQTSYRTGIKIVTGASQLSSIRIAAFPPQAGAVTSSPIPASPEHTRTIDLAYSEMTKSCFAGHAAFRALIKIQETAVGVDSPSVTLPALEFFYGDADLSYPSPTVASTPWPPASAFHRNLGWGYRPRAVGTWPTVEDMMLDVDGDGLIDRLVSEPRPNPVNGQAQLCGARWYRNKGAASTIGFQFEDAGYIEMPTLKWATNTASGTSQYCGGAHARDNGTTGTEERCSLNYQRTGYLNSRSFGRGYCHPMDAPCPTSPHPGYCHNYPGGAAVVETKNDCDHPKDASGVDTVFAWRWFDIDGDRLPDLIGSPIKGGLNSYDLQWGNGVGAPFTAPPEPAIFGTFPACPSAQYSASSNRQADPYTMCVSTSAVVDGISGSARARSLMGRRESPRRP